MVNFTVNAIQYAYCKPVMSSVLLLADNILGCEGMLHHLGIHVAAASSQGESNFWFCSCVVSAIHPYNALE